MLSVSRLKRIVTFRKNCQLLLASRIFDEKYYNLSIEENFSRLAAIKHYLRVGWKNNLNPSRLFSNDYYLIANRDVYDSGENPLVHFIRHGAQELRLCHQDFNLSAAVSALEDNGVNTENYLEDTIGLVQSGKAKLSRFFVDREQKYSDEDKVLVSELGLFSEDYYLTAYPDVASADIDPLNHYMHFGWIEDRNPSLQFDTAYFKSTQLEDDEFICPLVKVARSKNEGTFVFKPDHAIEFPEMAAFDMTSIKAAIHIHLYYPEVLKEITGRLVDLGSEVDLFISTTSDFKEGVIKQIVDRAGLKNDVYYKVVENTGRDLAPMFVGFGSKLSDYDYVCHLHSKKSPHTHFGERWRAYLFDQLIGNRERVQLLLTTLKMKDELGVLYPDNYFEIKKFAGWNGNLSNTIALFERLGFDVPDFTSFDLEFPAGSMCWFRPAAFRPLFSGALSLENFEKEGNQEESTLAHVLERCLTLVPEVNGFTSKKYYLPIADEGLYRDAWEKQPAPQVSVGASSSGEASRWLRDTPDIALNQRVELKPLHSFYNEKSLNIHWVIPDFGIGAGGHMTIFRIVKFLEEFGHRQTIWVQNARNYPTPKEAKKQIQKHYQPIGENVALQFLPEDVDWISGDVIIASDCWTVFPVLAMSRFKERFYLIQDWEPMFHPVGDAHLIAELTYSFGFNALCAGDWLHAKAEKAGMWARKWQLATDKKYYYPKKRVSSKKDILNVAFYARAYTPRRAVMMGVAALKELDRRGVNLHLSIFGEEGLDFQLGFSHEYLGILSPEELGHLYRHADLGVVFSATNYSLIPLEMMACGLPVLELETESTTAVFDSSYIEMVAPDPLAIADKLEDLTKDPEQIVEKATKALEFAKTLSWQKSAKDIEKALFEKLRAGAHIPIKLENLFDKNKVYKYRASVIIPTYNAGPAFEPVLTALASQKCDFDYEIVIVDSGSNDETLGLIKTVNDDRFQLIEIPNDQFQHGRTRNFAISKTQGEFVAVITQDALPKDEFWLANLVAGFDKAENVAGVFGAHEAYPEHSSYVKRDIRRVFERFDVLGLTYNWQSDFLEPCSLEWQFALQYYSDNNSCMRKSIWEKLPYPEINWGEDQAWAWMVVQLGLTKVYAKDAVVLHSHDDTVAKRLETATIEASFFRDVFGISLFDDSADRAELIRTIQEDEIAYGKSIDLDQDVIQHQLKLVEATFTGRSIVRLKNC